MNKFFDFIDFISNCEDEQKSNKYVADLASRIINSSTDAIIISEAEPIDTPGPRIVYVNETFVKETGYSPEDVIGKTPRMLQGPKTDPATRGRMREALKKWQPIREDILNYKKNGEEFWVSLKIFPIANENGFFTHWISIQHNITERKMHEAELLSARAELIISNVELNFQNEEKQKRAHELEIANIELIFQNQEKQKRADELGIANIELIFQNQEKQKRADELEVANIELIFQNEEKQKRAHELSIANIELIFQNEEKQKRSDELGIANIELIFQNEEKQKRSDEIKNLAFYDPLTQLANRRLLTDRLNQVLIASKRSGKHGALLFLDLDRFKKLNDTLGHSMGDLLLQQVATRLKVSVRESDTVSRFGGDEFVILLEDLGDDGVECALTTKLIAEKIIINLNRPYQLNEHLYKNSSSIGITLFNDHVLTAGGLLKQADIALYEAKNSGRNTFRFFENEMQETINALVNLERELADAIEQEQLELYYQLQIDDIGKPSGAEALIRWIHKERGVIMPSEFIQLAEDSGLVLPLGKWVLEAACRQLKIWEGNTLTCGLNLSVNISIKQFSQLDFADQVKTTLAQHAINPALLKLELTESAFIKNIESVILTMDILKEVGIQFELDDFGTGYSSLQYLKRLPLQRLKIDQSFVRDIEFDNNDKQIVFTIIAMAKNLGLSVIAEGVETVGQELILRNQGCLHYQGYLFGKPLPIAQFEHSLSNNYLALNA